MTTFIIILLIVLVIIVAITLYIILKKQSSSNDSAILLERLKILAEQNNNLREVIDKKLAQTHETTEKHFGQTTKIMQEITNQSAKYLANVTERLTKLDETNRQIINFSSQLQNLQDILKNPKQRGVLGEYFLEETLKNVLPPNSYEMQYKFKNGDIVDAVVFVKNKIVPIDSKFSLENYERILTNKHDNPELIDKLTKQFTQDLKKRIDETSKYIKPQENTMDFAFMFIPSEAIYYDLLVNKFGAQDLIKYAFADKKVIIVSPTSFLAYLQTVLQGLRAMQIEESAKQIRTNLIKLGKHLTSYNNYFQKLGNSLSTSVNHYNQAYLEFKKIDKDISKITDGESEIEPLKIAKPNLD